jgi:hypothetical protein
MLRVGVRSDAIGSAVIAAIMIHVFNFVTFVAKVIVGLAIARDLGII